MILCVAHQIMTKKSSNRTTAIENNHKTYEGKPCKDCGGVVRYVTSYGCVPCGVDKNKHKLYDSTLMESYRTKDKKQAWLDNNKNKRAAISKRYDDSHREQSRQYYNNNKDELRCKRLQRVYGISLDDYNILLDRQDGKCAICGVLECNTGRNFAVDHCHSTNKIRGLLCSKCNRGIGMFDDSIEHLQHAIAYLTGDFDEGLYDNGHSFRCEE